MSNQNWLDADDPAVEFSDHIDNDWKSLGPSTKQRMSAKVRKLGMEATKPFRDWLEESEGKNPENAKNTAMLAWWAIVEHGDNPTCKLLDDTLTVVTKNSIRRALRLFASYLIQDYLSGAREKSYARLIINSLAHIRIRNPLDPTPKVYKPSTPPMPESDIAKLLQAVETRHIREGARHAWARPMLRMSILTGLTRASEIVQIEKSAVREALLDFDQDEPATLAIWVSKDRSKIIPVHLVEAELRSLDIWPVPWGTLADLVTPGAQDRPTAALSRYRTELKNTCVEAGVYRGQTTNISITNAAIRRIYSKTRDLLLVQALSGVSIARLKQLDWLGDLIDEQRDRLLMSIK
jgi:integrase